LTKSVIIPPKISFSRTKPYQRGSDWPWPSC